MEGLDRFKGQFFIWYYWEHRSLPEVKRLFDKLFETLYKRGDHKYEASYEKWVYRRRLWRSQWNISRRVRGCPPSIPEELEKYEFWHIGSGTDKKPPVSLIDKSIRLPSSTIERLIVPAEQSCANNEGMNTEKKQAELYCDSWDLPDSNPALLEQPEHSFEFITPIGDVCYPKDENVSCDHLPTLRQAQEETTANALPLESALNDTSFHPPLWQPEALGPVQTNILPHSDMKYQSYTLFQGLGQFKNYNLAKPAETRQPVFERNIQDFREWPQAGSSIFW